MPNSEKRKEYVRQIIIRVKQIIKDMPDAEVLQRMLDAGEQTSITTIRRFKADGSEDAGFNYNLTVKPFAKVFLGLGEKPVEVDAQDSEEEKDRAALHNLLELKNIEIQGLKEQLEKEQKITAYLKEQVSFRGDQIIRQDEQLKAKDKQLDERRDFLYRKDKTIVMLVIALVICIALIFSALVVDSINPELGFFWLDEMASYIHGALHSGVDIAPGVQL